MNLSIFEHSTTMPIVMGNSRAGFTLVELMISLVLGLLISAAVVQIYITNVKTSTVQKSGSELQDASIFGIQQLESHLRLANLGNPVTEITNSTNKSGIVLTDANVGVVSATASTLQTNYFSHSPSDATATPPAWSGVSNTDINSDQLTIQFTNTTGNNMADCEGNTLANNETAIERFFLRASPATATTDAAATAVQNLVLACDAGRITGSSITTGGSDPKNFGQAGQDFITGVDQFKILLGTQQTAGTLKGVTSASATAASVKIGDVRYMTVHDYNALSIKPAITAVKIGLIVHGATPILGTTDATTFTLFNTTNTLKSGAASDKRVRTTYESTVLLRNARVLNIVSR